MEKHIKKQNAQALARLLRRIEHGSDPKLLRKEANRLLPSIGPADIAKAEQNLINDGFSAKQVQQLSAAFVLMAVLEEQTANLKINLPPNHILRRVLAEHEIFRCFLAELKDIYRDISVMEHMADTACEFQKLIHIVGHLEAMEEHISREEDVIFPTLKKHGWESLCNSGKSDHVYIRIAVSDLAKLTYNFESDDFEDFKTRLESIVTYLCPTMTEHLLQEDNILYPIALEVINDDKLWEKLKKVCNEIGYCGIHT
jgi:uncharacterized protein